MPEWLLTALVTTVGTCLVTLVGHRLTTRSDSEAERERHARYLAIRVICVLDPFVSECVSVAYDTGVPDPQGEMEPEVVLPNVTLPEDVDWRAVDPDLMYRTLGLPNEIAIADRAISAAVEYDDRPNYPQYFEERVIQYGKLGLSALQLAYDLRARYGIPPRDYGDWHPREKLETKVAEAEEKRAAREARQVEFTKKMWENHEQRKAANAFCVEQEGNG